MNIGHSFQLHIQEYLYFILKLWRNIIVDQNQSSILYYKLGSKNTYKHMNEQRVLMNLGATDTHISLCRILHSVSHPVYLFTLGVRFMFVLCVCTLCVCFVCAFCVCALCALCALCMLSMCALCA